MNWKDLLSGDPIPWLLEANSPGVRYLALRDLLDHPEIQEVYAARSAAHQEGPIAAVLNAMSPEGFWCKPGPGYSPKYYSTVWALILLGQLGASIHEDSRVAQACSYYLNHALTPDGQFTDSGGPGGTMDCLQGNMCWSLLEMGCEDSRLEKAFEWAARSITGEGVSPATERQTPVRYYAAKCGPNFACGANDRQPCAWGGVKLMLSFGSRAGKPLTPLLERAIKQGAEFFLSTDPATAAYPCGYSSKPNLSWWKFGFPVFYISDILQIVEAMAGLGYGNDPRLVNAISLVLKKQDSHGRWPMEYSYTGKTWVEFGEKKLPNKWVTLRVLRALKRIYPG